MFMPPPESNITFNILLNPSLDTTNTKSRKNLVDKYANNIQIWDLWMNGGP